MDRNPYTLTFGKLPDQMIERISQTEEVVSTFRSNPPVQQTYIITGIRGSGKTVFMSSILKTLSSSDEWIAVELNPERDLLKGLLTKLTSDNALVRIFKSAKINLSFFGLGLEISGEAPITDTEVALSKMLSSLGKKGKKVLIAIDEVTNSRIMREFAHSFQIFLRQNLPVYLLMTGLYDNIYTLQNEKSMTFLYRSPKLHLSPLNTGTMANNYMSNIGVSKNDALEMARITRGYPFAFQLLGYLTCEKNGDFNAALPTFKQSLEEFVYEKIWSELSKTDKDVLVAMAEDGTGQVSSIREKLGYDTNHFNPYRMRLIRKGIIEGETNGHVSFCLPLFDEFVLER